MSIAARILAAENRDVTSHKASCGCVSCAGLRDAMSGKMPVLSRVYESASPEDRDRWHALAAASRLEVYAQATDFSALWALHDHLRELVRKYA